MNYVKSCLIIAMLLGVGYGQDVCGDSWCGIDENCDTCQIDCCGECGDADVEGCTDDSACNYNPDANVDDGSCLENDCAGECGGSAV